MSRRRIPCPVCGGSGMSIADRGACWKCGGSCGIWVDEPDTPTRPTHTRGAGHRDTSKSWSVGDVFKGIVTIVIVLFILSVVFDDDSPSSQGGSQGGREASQGAGAPTVISVAALIASADAKRNNGDWQGARDDYAAALARPNATPEEKASAIAGRASVRVHQYDETIADYEEAARLTHGTPVSIDYEQHAARARIRRGVESHSGDYEAKINEFNTVLELPNLTPDIRSEALRYRGDAKHLSGRHNDALVDYSAAMIVPYASASAVGFARIHRGRSWDAANATLAMADFTAAIQIPNADPWPTAYALIERAKIRHRHFQDKNGANADLRAAAQMEAAPSHIVESALDEYEALQQMRSSDYVVPEDAPLLRSSSSIRARCVDRYLEINRTEPRFSRSEHDIDRWCSCTANNLASAMTDHERRLYARNPETFYGLVLDGPTPEMGSNHRLATRVGSCQR